MTSFSFALYIIVEDETYHNTDMCHADTLILLSDDLVTVFSLRTSAVRITVCVDGDVVTKRKCWFSLLLCPNCEKCFKNALADSLRFQNKHPLE